MGTIFDVFRGTTHDYVDSPFWSLMQIKVKLLDRSNESAIMDEDLGKVRPLQFKLNQNQLFITLYLLGSSCCKSYHGSKLKRPD